MLNRYAQLFGSKRLAGIELHQDVHVAIRPVLALCRRAEDRHGRGRMLGEQPGPFAPQGCEDGLQGAHGPTNIGIGGNLQRKLAKVNYRIRRRPVPCNPHVQVPWGVQSPQISNTDETIFHLPCSPERTRP